VFAEPWQAQAFALAVRLSAQGHFTWSEWTTALAAQLASSRRSARGKGWSYYEDWLAALEQLVTSNQLAGMAELRERKNAWAEAYRGTPHGQSVRLRANE
jgi:nitrile hydratase accessory protein